VRPWSQLVRIIQHMDPWTRTGRAIADDDELHRMLVVDGRPRSKRRRPAMAEWNRDDELLATLRDVAERIATTVAAVNTPKGSPRPKFKPELRPRNAADRAELMADLQIVAEIVELATPWGTPPRREV
jgi:hypothetical protein